MSTKKSESKALTIPERASKALAAASTVEQLTELAKASVSIVAITNGAGYDQCHAARMALKRARLDIERVGKAAREDAQTFSKAVIAEEKKLVGIITPEESRLEKLQEDYDAEQERIKQERIDVELRRVEALQERVAELRGCQTLSPSSGSALIADHISDLEKIQVDESFEEFEQQAQDAKGAALKRLADLHAAALAHETEQARIKAEREELAKLRAAEEQRAAQERARLAEEARQAKAARDEQDRKDREAREAEEAKLRAERAAQEAELRRRREEQERAESEARARLEEEQAKIDADRRALAAEQEVIERAKTPLAPAPISEVHSIPSLAEMIGVLAQHYRTTPERVTAWLGAYDWSEVA